MLVNGPLGVVNLGSGHNLSFDPDTLVGKITPTFGHQMLDAMERTVGLHQQVSYTGSDLRLMIEVSETPKIADARGRYAKQLLEATTITVSVHREVDPARACGYINPKGFAVGRRTIAGTIILTQFSTEVLMSFLQSVLMIDGSKDTTRALLPPTQLLPTRARAKHPARHPSSLSPRCKVMPCTPSLPSKSSSSNYAAKESLPPTI